MTTKQAVYNTLRNIGVGHQFSGFYIERTHPQHQLSGLRLLRKLRQEGKIDYEVVNRKKSLYKLTALES